MKTSSVSRAPTTDCRKKNYKWFIGIDVSKNVLDFAVLHDSDLLLHSEIINEKHSIVDFTRSLKQRIPGFRMANTLFCMEQTGVYGAVLTKALNSLKANFAVENALRIRRSAGLLRGKDDQTDAARIATYARNYNIDIRLWEPRRPILEELKYLSTLKTRLQGISSRLNHPVNEQELFLPKGLQHKLNGLCQTTIDAARADLHFIELAIDHLIDNDPELNRLVRIITSVKSIGKITAIEIILATNEFRTINCPKKFACYAGIAPFKQESGIVKKKHKISPIANRKMKTLLHLCAMGAVYRQPELKAYFERKTKVEGKPKMAVINAVRYKLILRVFACVRQDRLYTIDYIRPQGIPEASEIRLS
jgi:transposase